MAYIKERGNNNFLVRVSHGTMENGRAFQKSRLFHPSKINLPESKLRKELDAFVKALEEECRIEFESKYVNHAVSSVEAVEPAAESQPIDCQDDVSVPTTTAPLFSDFCEIYIEAKKKTISSTTYVLYNMEMIM